MVAAIVLTVLYGLTWYLYPTIGTHSREFAHGAAWSYGLPILIVWQAVLVRLSSDEGSAEQSELVAFAPQGLGVLLITIWVMSAVNAFFDSSPHGFLMGMFYLLIAGPAIVFGIAAAIAYFVIHTAAFFLFFIWIKRTIVGAHYLFTHHSLAHLAGKGTLTAQDAKDVGGYLRRMQESIRRTKGLPMEFVSKNRARKSRALRELLAAEIGLGLTERDRVIADDAKER